MPGMLPPSNLKTHDILKAHAHNLLSPSTPAYFSASYDPFRPGADFAKGTPYTLRSGVSTGLSHGLLIGCNDFDALTRIAKVAYCLKLVAQMKDIN